MNRGSLEYLEYEMVLQLHVQLHKRALSKMELFRIIDIYPPELEIALLALGHSQELGYLLS